MTKHFVAVSEDGLVYKASLPRAAGKAVGAVQSKIKGHEATVAGVGGAGAIVGAAGYHSRPNKPKKNLSQDQIDRKKKYQAFSWRATGGLGLAGMGLFTGAKLKDAKLANKILPATKKINPDAMKNAALGTSTTAGGIGGVAAMNSANVSEAEANQHGIGNGRVKKNTQISAFGVNH